MNLSASEVQLSNNLLSTAQLVAIVDEAQVHFT
jgi:hypothetical protein